MLDLLAIGDTVVDTFIRLKDAQVHCDINNEHCTISMRFGDKIPFEFSKVVPAVGNAPNAAVAAARLGLTCALIAGVGKDRAGEDCLTRFREEGIATEYVVVKDGQETSNNFVLWYGPERTILVRYVLFEYDLPDFPRAPRAVYLSGIGEANAALYGKVADWLSRTPETFFAFQPGTFEIKAGLPRLARLYARANVIIANKDEYQHILGSSEKDPVKLMEAMRGKGPKVCMLTDGAAGAYALDGAAWKMPVYPEGEHAYERTGAGDAFSASATAALVLGKTLPEALEWGAANAAFVVQKIGAQEGLQHREALEAYIKSASGERAPVRL